MIDLPAPGNAVYEAIERALQTEAKGRGAMLRNALEVAAKALITEACEDYLVARGSHEKA